MATTLKKVGAVIATFIMALTMTSILTATSAFAAGTGTITITPPTGTVDTAQTTYSVYKVFDADGNGTSISYKLLDGKSTSEQAWTNSGMGTYFTVDDAGNVTATAAAKAESGELSSGAIEAIKSYVTAADLSKAAADQTVTGQAKAQFTGLANGYYYITTTTGTAVTINSTNPNAEVQDKNAVPTVDKKITGANSIDDKGKAALAQLGSMVTYTATVTLGNGTENVKFHDVMGKGLSYNGDVKVYTDEAGTTEAPSAYYTVPANPDNGDTLTVKFTDGKSGVYYVKYTATVTSDALTTTTTDDGKNTATISYGNDSSTTSTPSTTQVYNAKFTVTKKAGSETGNPLAGAGFVIKNDQGKYYKYTAATGTTPATVEWVDSIDSATEYTSDDNGAVTAFSGLANGTYTLVEKTVPAGYNKAADSTFTVAEDNYTTKNLDQSKTVVNNAGSALPTTGGMGTTLLYVVGGILIAGAAVALITRKRMKDQK